jgi:predicted PurR-regulated permease PerM
VAVWLPVVCVAVSLLIVTLVVAWLVVICVTASQAGRLPDNIPLLRHESTVGLPVKPAAHSAKQDWSV